MRRDVIDTTMITTTIMTTGQDFAWRSARHERPAGQAGMVVLAIVAVAMVYRSFFFVDETEYVYVTQFGDAVRFCSNPGLGVKWPYQSLWRFDRRLQMYEPPAREMLTEDKENLNFEWYVCWRIPSPPFRGPAVV